MKEIKDLKLKDLKKLSELPQAELKAEYKDASLKLFSLSMKLQVNELKQTHLIKPLRRYVALLATVANQKGFKIN